MVGPLRVGAYFTSNHDVLNSHLKRFSKIWKKKNSVDPYLIRRIVINPDCLWTQASQSSLLALSDSGVLEGSIRITTFVPLATFGLVPKMKKGKSLFRRRKLNSHVVIRNLIGKDFSIWIFFLGTDSYILKALHTVPEPLEGAPITWKLFFWP